MDTIDKKDFARFISKVKKARELNHSEPLHHHDLEMYCQTLINGATLVQLTNSMACSDRLDLVDSNELGTNPVCDLLAEQFQKFTREYLQLELYIQGDPRGCSFRLVVDPSLGDSFGNRTHLCVPSVDAYQCW